MDNRGKRQASSIFGGMGFYIALLVCVVAAGVVGYFALLRTDQAPREDPAPSAAGLPDPIQSAAAPAPEAKPEPARPVSREEPLEIEQPAALPVLTAEEAGDDVFFNEDDAPAMEESPIEAVEPMIVVSPLAGETAAVFSLDRLSYDATLGDWRTHDGIDILADAGTAVVSASAGVVLSVEESDRMGTTVTVDHRNGYVTTYASLQPEVSVLAGDSIPAGAVIGAVGNTSLTEAGWGAHLHFSVSRDGELIDPAVFLGE